MLLRFLFTAWIYMDVPLMRPNEEPFGNLTVEHWSESPQNAFHFGYSILFAVSILVLLPLWARRYALRKGVLTPFELLYLWFAPYTFSLALEDLDFSVTARVQRGIQSLALADRQRSTFVLLPPLDELHRDARYRAPNGLDLLAGEKSEAQ